LDARNFLRRVEVAFPIENPALRDEIVNGVLPKFVHDRVKARELQPTEVIDDSNPRARSRANKRSCSFASVRDVRRKNSLVPKKERAAKLIPITVAKLPQT